jgi:(p)ppGpp synthase/HD superfamily hydrolase
MAKPNPFVKAWKYFMSWFGAKVDEKADPKIQIQQAIQEAQNQHAQLTRQAATVIGNQRQLEMKLDRQLNQVETLQLQARQALVLADRARSQGDEAKAADFEETAQALANQLVSAEQSVSDLKALHDQSIQAAGQAREAVDANASMLQEQLAQRLNSLADGLKQAVNGLDADTLIAAILHDVIEDTPTPKDEIAARFGNDVAEIVDGVTKLDQIQFKSRQEAQAESFRKMLLAMVRDLRVILVKLADRTHNLRTMDAVAPAKRRQVARETLDIYAPVAERLGLYTIKLELEELGFRTLYPQRYRVIERALRRARGNQKEFLAKIRAQLEPALKKAGIAAEVETREKHLYSVYQKMQRKRAPLAEIVDVYGLRIIVDSVDTCYRAIGVVHSVFKPMPGRFKDYVAIPRVNGYQSLHTTLFGPNAVPIEVQIRTRDMDRVAEACDRARQATERGDATLRLGNVER